jgi:uncharacterized damage-inducible protein DinB
MPSLESIAKNLVRAELEFLAATELVSQDQWKTCPAEGRWSAGELVCHLIMVERLIIHRASKLFENRPTPRPFRKRFHLPMLLVQARLIPRKTPIPLDPVLVREKDAMLEQLREIRARTLVFMEAAQGKDLRKYHMPHPFLGTLNGQEWFQMIASHQIRHTKQLKEIAAALPKTVTTSHK